MHIRRLGRKRIILYDPAKHFATPNHTDDDPRPAASDMIASAVLEFRKALISSIRTSAAALSCDACSATSPSCEATASGRFHAPAGLKGNMLLGNPISTCNDMSSGEMPPGQAASADE